MAGLGVCLGSALWGAAPPLPQATVVQRHGGKGYVLPHRIDHEQNMRALTRAGCDRVLAVGSVGGLRAKLGPRTFLCPDDFIALGAGPTVFDDERAHQIHGFDLAWRGRIVRAWQERDQPELVDGGVYWQTRGPRLETPAEIRLISSYADVVGMTIASECTVAGELGLAYAAICIVENLANGVGERELSMEELLAGRAANRATLAQALESVVPALS